MFTGKLGTKSGSVLSAKVNVRIVLEDVITKEKTTLKEHNMILTEGLNWIAKKVSNVIPTYIKKCELGRGATATNPSDADLETPDITTLVNITENSYYQNTTSFNTNYGLLDAISAPSGDWTEAGLWDDSGVLIARVVFSPLPKTNTQTLTIFWDFIFNREV